MRSRISDRRRRLHPSPEVEPYRSTRIKYCWSSLRYHHRIGQRRNPFGLEPVVNRDGDLD